eukprot:760537-Hanusia_phi.AAC.3
MVGFDGKVDCPAACHVGMRNVRSHKSITCWGRIKSSSPPRASSVDACRLPAGKMVIHELIDIS